MEFIKNYSIDELEFIRDTFEKKRCIYKYSLDTGNYLKEEKQIILFRLNVMNKLLLDIKDIIG